MKKPIIISFLLHSLVLLGFAAWFFGYQKAELQPLTTIEVSLTTMNQEKMAVSQKIPKEELALKKTAEEPTDQPKESTPSPQESTFQEASLLKGGYQVIPKYPESLRKRGVEGTVTLKAEVLTDGTVGNLWVEKSSGYGAFDDSALKAVKQWKFSPSKRMGIPVQDTIRIPVKFTLTET